MRGSFSAFSNVQHPTDELPNEIKTLDHLNNQVCEAIREYSISHSLDPVRRTSVTSGGSANAATRFERAEGAIREREQALLAY